MNYLEGVELVLSFGEFALEFGVILFEIVDEGVGLLWVGRGVPW